MRTHGIPKPAPGRVVLLALVVLVLPAAAGGQNRLASLDELEPNDDAASAQPIAVADTLIGSIGTSGDADWYELSVQTGERLRLSASSFDSPSDLVLLLYAQDGTTLIDFDDDTFDRDPLVVWTPDVDGAVFVVVTSYGTDEFGPAHRYRLTVEGMPVAPGDPPTLVHTIFGATGLAAGPGGELLFTRGQSSIDVLPAGAAPGSTSPIYLWGMAPVGGVAYDAFDRIIARADGAIVRLDSTGTVEHQLDEECDFCAYATAIDPAGNLLVQVEPGVVALYDPLLEAERYRVTLSSGTGFPLGYMAYAPDGDLLYVGTDRTRLYRQRLPATTPSMTFVAPSAIAAFAIDSLGYVYAPTERHGLLRISPDLRFHGVVAWDSVTRAMITFRNDTAGEPTDRIVLAPIRFYGRNAFEFSGAALAPGMVPGPRLDVLGDVPNAEWGQPYTAVLGLAGGATASTWTVTGGALPPGISLVSDGMLRGTPTEPGTFEVVVEARAGSQVGLARVELAVGPPLGLDVASIAAHLLGAVELGEAERAFVDTYGNDNGGVDLGDLVLFRERFESQTDADAPVTSEEERR